MKESNVSNDEFDKWQHEIIYSFKVDNLLSFPTFFTEEEIKNDPRLENLPLNKHLRHQDNRIKDTWKLLVKTGHELRECKEDLKDIKNELKESKKEIQECKTELKEVNLKLDYLIKFLGGEINNSTTRS